MSFLSNFVFYVGAATLGSVLIRFLRFLRLYTRPSSLPRYLHVSPRESGTPWAIVTGASDGIGLGFAQELAHRGFNVVLHGRNTSKLESLKVQLGRDYPGVEFRIVIADALKSTPEMEQALSTMANNLRDIHITVLINNCGGRPPSRKPLLKPFEQESIQDIDDMIQLNAKFPVQLTAAILPLLLRHGGPSLVLNIGSIGEMGVPWLSTYSGSKAFNMGWSRSLQMEMQGEGLQVEVLGICVAKVTSVSHCKEPPSFFVPDNRTFASAALDRVGCGRFVAVGYWTHALQKALVDAFPEPLLGRSFVETNRAKKESEAKKL